MENLFGVVYEQRLDSLNLDLVNAWGFGIEGCLIILVGVVLGWRVVNRCWIGVWEEVDD